MEGRIMRLTIEFLQSKTLEQLIELERGYKQDLERLQKEYFNKDLAISTKQVELMAETATDLETIRRVIKEKRN